MMIIQQLVIKSSVVKTYKNSKPKLILGCEKFESLFCRAVAIIKKL